MTDLRRQLQTIYDKHGALSPTLIVAAAKPAKHPLHDHFEWDNQEAGHKYRLHQAEELIRSIRITYTDTKGEKQRVREWHPVRVDQPTVYDPLDVISADPVAMTVLINQAEREWRQMQRRYGHLSEFWQMVRKDTAA